MIKKEKLDPKPKVEHSSSGRYVIRTEIMKDPVVKMHISKGYTPSCDNNHNYENIVDKDKQNRAINQIQRKKNKEKLIEKSRLQLEQQQKELESANQQWENQQSVRKSNSKKIILPKKLVNDIALVNEEIQLFQKEQIRARYEGEIEVEENKIRKQQRLITKQSVDNVQRSLQLINSIKVTNDPKEQFRQQEYTKMKISDINNALWDKQKKLQILFDRREEVRKHIEKIVSNYFQDEEADHLLQINQQVLKFFRVIFGKDYAMRLRMDKILASNDAELLKKQIQKTKELKKQVKPEDIFIPYNQSERYKKEKLGNKAENQFLDMVGAGSKTTLSQESEPGMMYKSLNLKQVPIYQAKHLEILETYFQKDVLQHLFDFYFNPISENLEYDFKSDTWNQLYEQFKANRLPKFKESFTKKEINLTLPPINLTNQINDDNNSSQDVQRSPKQLSRSMKAISTERQQQSSLRHIVIGDSKDDQSQQNDIQSQQSINNMSLFLGQPNSQQNTMYSKEFYQYLREYGQISDQQNKISKESVRKKIENRLDQCRQKYEYFEGQLDLLDNNNYVRKSPHQSPKIKSFANSYSPFSRQHTQKQKEFESVEQFSNEKIKTPPLLSVNVSTKDLGAASTTPFNLDSPEITQKTILSKEISQDQQPILLNQASSKKVNFQHEDKDIDQVIEQRVPINQIQNTQENTIQINKQQPKIKGSKSLTHIGKLKKISQDALNKCMKSLVNQAVSEETTKYLESVNKLYRQCRVESFKTRKVKNESIQKKNQFQKKYRQIDKEFKQISLL